MKFLGKQSRYKSKLNMTLRTTAQMLLLKPLVWSQLKVEVHGLEHLDVVTDDEVFIAVANHSSHFDAPLVIGGLPRRLSKRVSTGAAADYFFKHWYMAGPTSLFFNAFPVDRTGSRDRKGLAGQLLNAGVPLLLFPEGTRSRTGAMSSFKPGAAALCVSHHISILPIALVGAYAAWPAEAKRWLPGRPEVHIAFGSPMHPMPGEVATQFNERMRREVIQLHDATALAYGMPTQADMSQIAAIEKAERD